MKHRMGAIWRNEKGYLVEYNKDGRGVHLYWSPSEEAFLREHYPYVRSREIAEHLGKPIYLVDRKAKSMGLYKDSEYLRKMHAEQCFVNTYGRHRKGFKGVDKISEYMRNETPEQKAARIAKSVATRKLAINRMSFSKKMSEYYRNMTPEQREARAQKCREARARAIANGAVEKFKERYSKLSEAQKENRRKKISISQKKRLVNLRNEGQHQAV